MDQSHMGPNFVLSTKAALALTTLEIVCGNMGELDVSPQTGCA